MPSRTIFRCPKSGFLFIIIVCCYSFFGLASAIIHEGNGHDKIHEINSNYFLFSLSKNDIEGYSAKIGGGEFSYPSLRADVESAMISRASTGKMFFEFYTGVVPSDYSSDDVTFFFLSDIDLNLREPYDVIINDQLLLTFIADEDGTIRFLSNPGQGKAEYILIRRDLNGDGIGAFRLTVPTSALKKGERAKMKVQGHSKGSNSWFMIFKATDAIERLKVSANTEQSFSILHNQGVLMIDAPAHFDGRSVYVISDKVSSKKGVFKKQGEFAKVTLKIESPKKSFSLVVGKERHDISFPNKDGVVTHSDILGDYFYQSKSSNSNGWKATLTKLYRPSFFNAYSDFFDRKYEKGQVTVLNSSHQDIAWVDRPEVCIILRDTLLLTPILNDASVRSDYGFDIEDGLILREYLERHPDSKDMITELLKKKLISVGATYNCPYEDMYDSEDQVRQLYLGKKWVKNTFDGYDSKVYWNVDVPGKTLQYPQILKKAGVDYMVISRHARGMFHWASPDGSSVFTYSPGHYGTDIIQLSKEMGNKIKYGAEQVKYWDKYFETGKGVTPLLSDQDMLPAIDYSDFIDTWNNMESVKDSKGKEKSVFFPNMELMTADEFMPLAEKHAINVDTIRGERPNVWVYIHGPAHHEAITASREASKLLPAAEKFLAISEILASEKMPYPFPDLDEAWQAKIYPDHGWGGHDGDITDDLFKEKLVASRTMAQDLLDKGTGFIASRIKTDEKKGTPIVLFNSLSWTRTDPVTISASFQKGKATNLQLTDSDGNPATIQLKDITFHTDNSIKRASITFIATNVPAVGYKTFYLKPSDQSMVSVNDKESSTFKNDFYEVEFVVGGISRIYDRQLQKEILKTDRFKGGEVFTMQSIGNGAGEFGDIQQPTMTDYDKVGNYAPSWEVIHQGEVYSTYRIRQQILHAIVEQDVTVYKDVKRILFETKLLNWDGELYREFRTAFPMDMSNAQVTHEVPFGSVRIGIDEIQTAGERYVPLCKNVHPRAIIDWISATDNEMSVTLSSSVAAADWIDPTDENEEVILQHLLLASRTSCHWEGNEYSQGGNHYYNNILTSNKPGDITGTRMAKQQNEPLVIVFNPEKSINASLPEELEFFSLDAENVIITTIKKAENEEGYIVRLYDTEGKNTTVGLKSYFNIDNLRKTNIIEEFPTPVSNLEVNKYAIETFSFEANK